MHISSDISPTIPTGCHTKIQECHHLYGRMPSLAPTMCYTENAAMIPWFKFHSDSYTLWYQLKGSDPAVLMKIFAVPVRFGGLVNIRSHFRKPRPLVTTLLVVGVKAKGPISKMLRKPKGPISKLKILHYQKGQSQNGKWEMVTMPWWRST